MCAVAPRRIHLLRVERGERLTEIGRRAELDRGEPERLHPVTLGRRFVAVTEQMVRLVRDRLEGLDGVAGLLEALDVGAFARVVRSRVAAECSEERARLGRHD